MRQLSCADLIPGCEAVFCGETDNMIALQYVMHLHLMHRSWPVTVDQFLDVITDVQQDGTPPSSQAWGYRPERGRRAIERTTRADLPAHPAGRQRRAARG